MVPDDRCSKGQEGRTVLATPSLPLRGSPVCARQGRNYCVKTGSSFMTPGISIHLCSGLYVIIVKGVLKFLIPLSLTSLMTSDIAPSNVFTSTLSSLEKLIFSSFVYF